MSLHVVPLRVYITVFLALMLGTALTVFMAFVDLGWMNNLVAMAIACTKAAIVILFFMHVKYSSKLTWVVVGAGVFWLIILLGMLMLDYGSRGWMAIPPIVHG